MIYSKKGVFIVIIDTVLICIDEKTFRVISRGEWADKEYYSVSLVSFYCHNKLENAEKNCINKVNTDKFRKHINN